MFDFYLMSASPEVQIPEGTGLPGQGGPDFVNC